MKKLLHSPKFNNIEALFNYYRVIHKNKKTHIDHIDFKNKLDINTQLNATT